MRYMLYTWYVRYTRYVRYVRYMRHMRFMRYTRYTQLMRYVRYTRQRDSSLWRDRGDKWNMETSFWLDGSNTVEPQTQYNRKQSSRDDLIMQKLRSSKVLHGSLSTSWRPPAAPQIASASQPPTQGGDSTSLLLLYGMLCFLVFLGRRGLCFVLVFCRVVLCYIS